MDRPLGHAVGNSLETIEAFDVLHGRGPADLTEVTLALGASMLVMGGVARDEDEARAKLVACVQDGSAARVAREMVAAQGGDPRAVDDPSVFAVAPLLVPLRAAEAGYIAAIDTHAVGVAGVAMGAGRTRAEDAIDPVVGFVFERNVGDAVAVGDVIATVHARSVEQAAAAVARLGAAVTVAREAPAPSPLLVERVG